MSKASALLAKLCPKENVNSDVHELFSKPAEWRWLEKSAGLWQAEFAIDKRNYTVSCAGARSISIQFALDGYGQGITNTGNAVLVFATVLDIISDFLKQRKPEEFSFGAKLNQPSRVKLYRRMAKEIEQKLQYKVTEEEVQGDTNTYFFSRVS